MRTSRASVALPIPVRRAAAQAGPGHPRCPTTAANPYGDRGPRASISRTTLVKIEKGDPGVAMGIYATVLFVIGMSERLADIADPRNDPVGLQLEEEHLPQRIRGARTPQRTTRK